MRAGARPRPTRARASARRCRNGARCRSSLACLPDLLAGEAARPVEVGEPLVAGHRASRRAELAEVLHLEAVTAEQGDPLAVKHLEVDRAVAPVEGPGPEHRLLQRRA